ncbi:MULTISPECIES: hypothetical protein [Sphingobacterium]|uniref:hypothetical protein n=1 Tax=Sphingobacterium TaxID=28453 RepID=UPI00257EF7BE|nr:MULTISPECIES: hypothetical protein [Sphingobacterium]
MKTLEFYAEPSPEVLFHGSQVDNTDYWIKEIENYGHIKVHNIEKSYATAGAIIECGPKVTESKYYSRLKAYNRAPVSPWIKIDNIQSFLVDLDGHIQESSKILNYSFDWDDEGASACNPVLYQQSTELLKAYLLSLIEIYKVFISFPDINLCRDGSVDLEWRSRNKYILVINFGTEKIEYYGEDFKNNTIIKGTLSSVIKPNEDLLFWMKKIV